MNDTRPGDYLLKAVETIESLGSDAGREASAVAARVRGLEDYARSLGHELYGLLTGDRETDEAFLQLLEAEASTYGWTTQQALDILGGLIELGKVALGVSADAKLLIKVLGGK